MIEVRNLKYAAYEFSKYLEARMWLTYPWYDHHNRRFELFFGYFGVRCEIPFMLWISHAHDTWKNNEISIQLMLGNTELLGCETHPGGTVHDAFLTLLHSTLLDVRDNPWRYEQYVKQNGIPEDLHGKCSGQPPALPFCEQ